MVPRHHSIIRTTCRPPVFPNGRHVAYPAIRLATTVQPIFIPLPRRVPSTQTQTHNIQSMPTQGINAHTAGLTESSSQPNKLMHTYLTHASYMPQATMYNDGYHYEFDQGYNPYHVQQAMANGALNYPHTNNPRNKY